MPNYDENYIRGGRTGAYFINRRRGKSRSGWRAAGVMIAVLIILSAAICLLVVFLPRLTAVTAGAPSFGGQTFYFLATDKFDERSKALLSAKDTIERGGAGYIYNDGSYHIIAAVYDKESDAKALAAVNENSYYFSLTAPKSAISDSDAKLLSYIAGEWFTTVSVAAAELSRGNITEAQAEHAVSEACDKAVSLADEASGILKAAVGEACDYSCPQGYSVVSYIRYVQIDTVISAVRALSVATS